MNKKCEKKILIISYAIYEFNGRFRELRNVLKELGDVLTFSLGIKKNIYGERGKNMEVNTNVNFISIWLYLRFIILSINYSLKHKDVDIIVIHDTPATIPGLVLKYLQPKKIFIQDLPELKLVEEKKGFRRKFFGWAEEKMIAKSNILICANAFRAEIMKERFKLESMPVVYENIRRLEEGNDIGEECMKLVNKINPDKISMVNTGGFSIDRGTLSLVEAMKALGNDFELHIIGGGTKAEKEILQNYISENELHNVYLWDRFNGTEIKEIVKMCKIGIVNYHKEDLNNIYCASGRVYEYAFEGVPIVTTENIPLKKLCETYGIGECDDSFEPAIRKVAQNLKKYKHNVKWFMENISVESNNLELSKNLKAIIQMKEDREQC